MNTSLMFNSHQDSAAPWAWNLAPHEARTLAAESVTRWLHVDSGSVWLTRANGREQADDIWLGAGQSLELTAGSAWVLEAWPQARFSLLLQSPQAGALGSGPASWWRAAWRPALQRALAA